MHVLGTDDRLGALVHVERTPFDEAVDRALLDRDGQPAGEGRSYPAREPTRPREVASP